MAITYDYITIQASHTGLTPVIEAKQGDSGRGVVVTIPDIDLVGKTIYVFVKKPDDTEVYDYGSVNARGQAVINFSEQMLAAVGDAKMEMQIFQGETLVSSFNIIIKVLASLSGSSHVASTDDYRILRDLIGDTETAIENANEATENANTAADRIITDLFSSSGYSHNSHYRGKNLGDTVTAEQYAAIEAGTFDDMYIGDYWVINDTHYTIAAFNYYLNTGEPRCTTNHITIVPNSLSFSNKMNQTNTTSGGYVNSSMYTQGMNDAKAKIKNDFGEGHILTHRMFLTSATTDGYVSGRVIVDSEIELMTEANIFGGNYSGNINRSYLPSFQEIDNSQFPLFMYNHGFIGLSNAFWLRDVADASNFSLVWTSSGFTSRATASSSYRIRPRFSIKA